MKRWGFFVFGVFSHLLFLAVFAYMAGFVGNLLVPKSIDSAPQNNLGAIVIDLLLISLFGLQHSIMARPGFKRIWTKLIPPPIERSTYVLISNLIVMLLMWQWRGLDAVIWDVQDPLGRGLLWVLFAAGWLMVPAVSLMINHFDLFGTRQVWLYLRGEPYTALPFRTPLLYSRIRHPLYVGWALAFWATPTMTLGHLLFAGSLTLYMAIAALIEERDLISHFGDAYREYRRRVPMFIPGLGTQRAFLDTQVLGDLSWWHWAITVPLLAAHIMGKPWAIEAALLLCAAFALYYLLLIRRLRPFPVQVRLAYLGWLLIGLLPGMQWMHYVALVGTTAKVTIGFCGLARVLSLAWFNRSAPLTLDMVQRVLFAPMDGGLFYRRPVLETAGPSCSCSLSQSDQAQTCGVAR